MDDRIKVTDKRMFDASGELREEYRQDGDSSGVEDRAAQPVSEPPPEVAEPKPAVSEAPAAPPPGPEPSGHHARGGRQLPEPGIMDLIDLLAQPIVMFLGDAPLPDGGSAQDLGLARYHIDLLELVAAKTKGNLDPREEKLLEDLLYQFRLRYVEKAG